MKTAEYPQRKCRIPVAGEWNDYPCEVREYHPGPCASLSVKASIQRREKWEEENPGWERLNNFDDPFKDIKP
jgi:hypothetical protein